MSEKEKDPEEQEQPQPEEASPAHEETPPRPEQEDPHTTRGTTAGDAPAAWLGHEPAGDAPASEEEAQAAELREEESWTEPIPLVDSPEGKEGGVELPPAEPEANLPEAAVAAAPPPAELPQADEPGTQRRPKPAGKRRKGHKMAARTAGGALGVFSLAAWRRQWQSQKEYHGQQPPPFQTVGDAAKRTAAHLASPFNILQLLIFAGLVLVFLWQASVHWSSTLDDAYITFRFVDMFSQGFGWVYNPEGPRVEGFTTFLWPVLLLIPHWFGAELMYISKLLGLFSGAMAMVGAWALAAAIRRRNDLFNLIPPAILAFNSWFSYWALVGMETHLQVALVALTYARFELERRDLRRWQLSPVLGFLAIVARVDSAFYLLPLAAYALLMLARKQWPWARFRRAVLIGLLPALLFWGWRYVYFGDWLPNTYYAKMTVPAAGEQPKRGRTQINAFYLSHPVAEPVPMQRNWLPEDAASTTAVTFDNATRFLPGTKVPGLLWANFWVLGSVLAIMAAALSLIGLGSRRRLPHWEAVLLLVFAPWAMSVYYVLHVNGDWMPNFRFFQVALIFIGVAGAAGFGSAAPLLRAFWAPRYGRWLFSLVSFLLVVYLLAGVAREQLRTKTVSIYGPDFTSIGARDAGWWHPLSVRANYGRAFTTALPEVAGFLLLNTQDNSWILMGDIGFPLWAAPHLSLYDADGLVDKHIGHAPSVRGRRPGPQEVLEEMLASAEGPLSREERSAIRERARLQYQRITNEHNARLIMEQRRPEYIAFHSNHAPGAAAPEGGVVTYPGPSSQIRRHPDFETDYTPLGSVRKTATIRTHFLRRADVEEEVPVELRVDRVLAAIERNPRVGHLYATLFDQAEELPGDAADRHERVDEAARAAARRLAADREALYPILDYLSGRGQDAYIQELFEARLSRNPADLTASRMLSDLHRANGDWDRAQDVLREALRHRPPNPRNDLRHLLWMASVRNDPAREIEALGLLLVLEPESAEMWYRFARLHQEQEAVLPLSPTERTEFLQAALTGYERAMQLDPERYGTAEVMIQGVQRRIDEVSRQTLERAIPDPPPTPAPMEEEEPTPPAQTKPLDDEPLDGTPPPDAPPGGPEETGATSVPALDPPMPARPETDYDPAPETEEEESPAP